MWLKSLMAAALMAAALPASAATMRAVVSGTVLSDSRTVQPYDRDTGISGEEATFSGPLAGQTIRIVYDYAIDAPVNDPSYDPAEKRRSGRTEGQARGMVATVTIGTQSWSLAGYRGGDYRIGFDAFAESPDRNASLYGLGVASSPLGLVEDWTRDGITYGRFQGYSLDLLAEAGDLSIPYAPDRPFSIGGAAGTIFGGGTFFFGTSIYADEPAGLRQVFADRLSLDIRLDRLAVTRRDPPAPVPLPAPALLLLAGPLALGGIGALGGIRGLGGMGGLRRR